MIQPVRKKKRASKIGEHDTSRGSVQRDISDTPRISVERDIRKATSDVQEKEMRCLQ